MGLHCLSISHKKDASISVNPLCLMNFATSIIGRIQFDFKGCLVVSLTIVNNRLIKDTFTSLFVLQEYVQM